MESEKLPESSDLEPLKSVAFSVRFIAKKNDEVGTGINGEPLQRVIHFNLWYLQLLQFLSLILI